MCDGPLPSPPPPLADQIPLNGPLQVPLDGSEAEANVARLEPSPPPPPPPPQVLPILQAGTISKPSVVATNSGPPQDLLSAIRAGYQLRKVSDRQTGSGVTNGYNTNTLNSKPRDVQVSNQVNYHIFFFLVAFVHSPSMILLVLEKLCNNEYRLALCIHPISAS
ncbi:unnamed protein product [Protopolystoma xenopodis]|uniref:WH2 domain-containing protein n=1 Tax=Protopolystoma xenopodis TaxID=117903 RepID=A0A448X292_9PLAT|nr:unnamed protein product [Protopolystoma xenopodis]